MGSATAFRPGGPSGDAPTLSASPHSAAGVRCRILVLGLTPLAGGATTGGALVGDSCAGPVTGTATYVSGSTPTPHHHEWTVRLEASSGA